MQAAPILVLLEGMSDQIAYVTTALDARDPAALAAFYATILDWTVVRDDGDWVVAQGPDGRQLSFQLAENVTHPDWPRQSIVSHIDLRVDSYAETEPKVLAAGATRLDGTDEIPERPGFRVYADPEGHLFCLCLSAPTTD